MKLDFALYGPDAATLGTGYTSNIANVYPTAVGYSPVKAQSAYSAALASACRGFISVQTSDGSTRVFAATATKLYLLASDLTWTDVSLGAGTYNGPGADENWSFAVFDGYLYATNVNDALQRYNIDGGGAFAAVAGSPPQARYVSVVESYLVLANLTSDQGAIAWCDTGDATNWSTGNADEQSFPDGGPVMGVLGAAKRVVQKTTERMMIHQPGSAFVFYFEKVANARGTIAPQSIIEVGDSYAYLAEDGFYFDGQPIGKERVDVAFLAEANNSRLFSVMGGFDPVRRIFRWAYHTDDGVPFDKQLVFSPTAAQGGKWAPIDDDTTYIGNAGTPGITLEGLEALYPDLDVDVPYSLDSRVWQGGRPTFAVFGTDHKLSFYEGTTLEATMETAEGALAEGREALLLGTYPLIDGDTGAAATARVGTRGRLAGTVSYSSYASLQTSGRVPARDKGKYVRVGVKIPAAATWTHARGVEIVPEDVKRLGRR